MKVFYLTPWSTVLKKWKNSALDGGEESSSRSDQNEGQK